MTERTLIGSARAAEILGIDKSTLTRWIIAGKLRATKLEGDKGAYVLDLADVEEAAGARRAWLADTTEAAS